MAINRYSKQYLRKFYLDRRKRLTSAERMQLVTQMTLHFDAIPLKEDAVLHVFLPISRHFEPDTLIIKKFLQHKHPKMTFVVSKTLWETGQLEHYHWDEQMQFEENRLGIPEPVSGQIMKPKDLDAVLVPMLAFDTFGHRVGYGKGFYDRFLAACRPQTLKIGINYFQPVPRIEDTFSSDISLDYCVTPNQLFSWTQSGRGNER